MNAEPATVDRIYCSLKLRKYWTCGVSSDPKAAVAIRHPDGAAGVIGLLPVLFEVWLLEEDVAVAIRVLVEMSYRIASLAVANTFSWFGPGVNFWLASAGKLNWNCPVPTGSAGPVAIKEPSLPETKYTTSALLLGSPPTETSIETSDG